MEKSRGSGEGVFPLSISLIPANGHSLAYPWNIDTRLQNQNQIPVSSLRTMIICFKTCKHQRKSVKPSATNTEGKLHWGDPGETVIPMHIKSCAGSILKSVTASNLCVFKIKVIDIPTECETGDSALGKSLRGSACWNKVRGARGEWGPTISDWTWVKCQQENGVSPSGKFSEFSPQRKILHLIFITVGS